MHLLVKNSRDLWLPTRVWRGLSGDEFLFLRRNLNRSVGYWSILILASLGIKISQTLKSPTSSPPTSNCRTLLSMIIRSLTPLFLAPRSSSPAFPSAAPLLPCSIPPWPRVAAAPIDGRYSQAARCHRGGMRRTGRRELL